MGNHDNQGGEAVTRRNADILKKRPHFFYEDGAESIGNGNFAALISEKGKPVEGLIFADTHNLLPYKNTEDWGRLLPEQHEWYKNTVDMFKRIGCNESILFQHIPLFAYKLARDEAYKSPEARRDLKGSYDGTVWNDGFEGAFGVCREEIASWPEEDGSFDIIRGSNHTKNVIVGHSHTNNFSIPYKGVRLTFSVKAGPGGYWDSEINGGTVIRIGNGGFEKIEHIYVKPRP